MSQEVHPLTAYLRANFVQKKLKDITGGRYADFTDAQLANIVSQLHKLAEVLPEEKLTDFLSSRMGLSKSLKKLPRDQISWWTVDMSSIVTVLWVGDLPHEITHGTLADIVSLVRNPDNRSVAPYFYDKVHRLSKLPFILELPSLVVAPSSGQRSARKNHCSGPGNTGAECTVERLEEGEAYIEDGNHRAVAQLLAGQTDSITVIRYDKAAKKTKSADAKTRVA
ncbi:hypothetical protein LV476_06790 [Guyparkeria hydrothermalis]|uniref:hypothetical protein n=1 Tax=Guyparkeria hydrothermalis TaxID=923 RepID=UPI0020201CDF|nr:hypothetical protein [Guyparkeria hydrothermalis]MCL7744654.1 hypothetical protein [Guyparkeria hydrothermalis]